MNERARRIQLHRRIIKFLSSQTFLCSIWLKLCESSKSDNAIKIWIKCILAVDQKPVEENVNNVTMKWLKWMNLNWAVWQRVVITYKWAFADSKEVLVKADVWSVDTDDLFIDSIGRIDNSRQGFFVRDRGHRNCEGLWKRCMEISEGTSKRGSCVRGYNKLWCKDQACPGQGWCENESQLGSN